MDSENRKWNAFQLMGVMSKNQKKKKKRNYNSQLEYRKTSRGANEISKLPQAKCLRAKIDETCNKFREQCRFFSQKKTQRRRKVTLLFVEVEYVCWPRTEARRKKKLSAKCFREGTKVKKLKNDKKRIVLYVAFISKNIILKERLVVIERKERRKGGTYVKRAMWWRDKLSHGRLLRLSRTSKVAIR